MIVAFKLICSCIHNKTDKVNKLPQKLLATDIYNNFNHNKNKSKMEFRVVIY